MATIATDDKGLDARRMLEGIELQRDGNNFRFTYPNGSMRDASMSEVLMWELLRELRRVSRNGMDARS